MIGALFIGMALAGTLLKRLPISGSMLYLVVGFALGTAEWGPVPPDPRYNAGLLERVTEAALLISLFSVGLKLNLPLSGRRWYLPLRLAFGSMALTVALIALIGFFVLGLPLGAAILLGGILAPTDPILATDVQVDEPGDRDRLRFSLSGEGGLNDATAFPFVYLGLGLLGLRELGAAGSRWLAVDVVWAFAAGTAIGALFGILVGKLVVYLRIHHREAIGQDEFLALGLIALAYGAAQVIHASGFLAVFAAGVALQRSQTQSMAPSPMPNDGPAGLQGREAHIAVATHPGLAGVYMTQAVRGFNEQMERIAELAIVLVVGAMLPYADIGLGTLTFVAALFIFVRPLAVWIGLLGATVSREQRLLISWFGIRGIGSLYYLAYALHHGLAGEIAEEFITLTLTTITASILVHGISVTPLMNRYTRRRGLKNTAAGEDQ
jgi:NhaP-type Na+/H+ or K+/H+ antiporter